MHTEVPKSGTRPNNLTLIIDKKHHQATEKMLLLFIEVHL